MNDKKDSDKIEVRGGTKFGNGLFAKENISKDEFVVGFYGMIYPAETALDLPEICRNHAIQFEEHKFIDSLLARNINHSCNPNCGLKGLFDVVAMRDIKAGEELTWDYAMSEDSNWRMKCKCGEKNCRGIVGAYSLLPEEIRDRYREYTSVWILAKYEK